MYEFISGFSDEIAADIDTQFSVLNKLGIKYFEPRGVNGKNISELNEEEVLQLKSKMDEYGIAVSSIGSPVGKIYLEEDYEPHFEMFKRVVKTAKTLGTRNIRIFSFYHNGDEWTAEEREDVINRLLKMREYAEQEGVVLLHENEKDIYGDTDERCLDLMNELYSNNFKAVFDPANFVQSGVNTLNAYDMLEKYIAYMHIKDAKKADGDITPAGMADGNVKEILSRLFKKGYNGYLSLEPHLGEFVGLYSLEQGDLMKNLQKGGEGTFTLAFKALNKLLDDII